MSTRYHAIYDRLPVSLQNGVLGLYGLNNVRRKAAWHRVLRSISPSEHWTVDQQIRYTETKLRDVLSHAILHVPHYRDRRHLLDPIRDPAADVRAILQEFPAITKAEILEAPHRFLSVKFRRRRLRRTVTSGTTGTPFTAWLEPRALLASDALWWRRTLWAGYRRPDWIARLVGDPVIPLKNSRPHPPYRVSATARHLYFSAYHLDPDVAMGVAGTLLARQPAFLMGYPSALYTLFRLTADKLDFHDWQPRAILYSSEPMYPHQLDAIRAAVDAPVLGLYGCAERTVSAAECRHGNYHLSLIDGFVEGQFGEPAPSERTLVTGLLNHAMPLIRYDLGDSIVPMVGQTCPCGRTLPLIEPVITKREDTLTTPSGKEISSSILTWAFKDLEGVRRSQIVQRSRGIVEVLVEAEERDFPTIRRTLAERLGELVFGELDIRMQRVDVLELTSAGKTRFVINEARPAKGPATNANTDV